MSNNLKVKVGSVQLSTPLLLASGHITETADFFLKTEECAGVVTRSLKEVLPPERKRTPSPRYVVFDDGHSMLNCEWGNSIPWTYWRDDGIATVKDVGGAMVISLSGRDIEGCSRLIEKFNMLDIDAYEINISCSHSGAIHGNLNIDFDHMTELFKKIRPLTKKPIWIKLSYSSFLMDMAKCAEELGADAIVCTNSIGPGMFIDIKTATPRLGIMGGAGGVTGRAIFPIALNCVYKLAQTVAIPIIGSGGIATGDDVVQMMMAGASAVQLYTEPALNGPQVFRIIASQLESYLDEQGVELKDIVGAALHRRDVHCFEQKVPVVDAASCCGCARCVTVCDFGAMMVECGQAHILKDKCVGCSACISVCPTQSLAFPERRD